MKVHKADFSRGNVSTLIIKVAMPMILAEFVNLLYSMVDRIFIGHIPGDGSLALTGLGICFPVISLISAFARLYGFNGGAPLCGMALGRQDEEEARYVMGNSFVLSVLTGGVLMMVVLIFNKPILYAFGASEDTYPFARDYLMIYALGSIPVLVTLGMTAFINTQGFSVVGMFTVIIGAVTNIILDPIFIYIFSLGVQGAAIATVISQLVSCTFVIRFLTVGSATVKLSPKYFRLGRERTSRICTLGLSGFTMGATNSVVQLICNLSAAAWGGDLYVGVMTILNSVREIFMTPVSGLGSGASPVMSYNYGARDGDRVRKASNFTLLSCLVITGTVWLVVLLFPQALTRLFTQDEELIQATIPALHIYFFGFIFMAFQTAGQHTFVALGKTKPAVFFSLFRKVIIVVPLTLILPYFVGIDGVMLAEPISNVVGGLAAYLTMRHIVMPELATLKRDESGDVPLDPELLS